MNRSDKFNRITAWAVHYIVILFGIVVFPGCSRSIHSGEPIDLAGENREAIEHVLKAFGHDSLKLRYAEWLIEGACYHYTSQGADLDSFRIRMKGPKMDDNEKRMWEQKDLSSTRTAFDIERVSDTLLIDNINLAVDTWLKRPWSHTYSDTDFKNYILPYRIGDEPLENWRGAYLKEYSAAFDSLCHDIKDPAEAAYIMLTYIRKQGLSTRQEMKYPHLGAMHLLKYRKGYCRDHCDLAIYALRALGIPVATDFYEQSPSYNSRHYWTAVIDTLHRVREFNLGDKIRTWQSPQKRKKGKVYREMFFPVKTEPSWNRRHNTILSNPFVCDVSHQYGFNTSINIPVGDNIDHLYLSLFTGCEYHPVAETRVIKSNAAFDNVEDSLIFFPSRYSEESGTIVPTDYPILSGAKLRTFIPDYTQKESVSLTRKYPMRRTAEFHSNMVGQKILFHSNPSILHATSIEIVDTPQINIVKIPVPPGARYVSFQSPANKRIELSETWITDSQGNKHVPLKVTLSTDSTQTAESILATISDSQWETCYISSKNESIITLEFDSPISGGTLFIVPRTDDNYVRQGDTYELFVHHGEKGWKSLGRQTAVDTSLRYTVPCNAVFWLKSHSRGKEERPFYIKRGIQIFP